MVGNSKGIGPAKRIAAHQRAIRDRCLEAGVPFYFKQWGGVIKRRHGRMLDGRTWDEEPRGSVSLPGRTDGGSVHRHVR